jgi:FkbM family methyltransferase
MSDTSEATSRSRGPERVGLPALAWKVANALPRADRLALALRLLEAEADEITFKRAGIKWTAFAWDNIISHSLFVNGNFQGSEIRAVLDWMRRHGRIGGLRDSIIDLGANIGTSTLPFAMETNCRVIAIEPVPEIFAVLLRNVADNALSQRVTCVQAAVSATSADRVRMVLPAGNGGGGEVCRPGAEPNFTKDHLIRGVIDVPAMALDQLFDTHEVEPEQVAFVWSDTQGCEAEVIGTGRRLWSAGVPLFVEFDPRTWDHANGPETLVAAATECFAGFIPAELLLRDADAEARPIAELSEFCRAIGPLGSDVLLLPRNS